MKTVALTSLFVCGALLLCAQARADEPQETAAQAAARLGVHVETLTLMYRWLNEWSYRDEDVGLVAEKSRPNIMFQESANGKRIPVAIRIYGSGAASAGVACPDNPLASMTAPEIAALKRVWLNAPWRPELERQVRQLPPYLEFTVLPQYRVRQRLPPLPPDLQSLTVGYIAGMGYGDLAELRKQTKLESVQLLRVNTLASFDPELFSGSRQTLRSFEFWHCWAVLREDGLGLFTNLEYLNVSYQHGFDGHVLPQLRKLKAIDISGSSVASLDFLMHLPEIEIVIAENTAITKLPASIPSSLRTLIVTGIPLSLQELNAWAQAHQQCLLSTDGLRDYARSALAADRIAVFEHGDSKVASHEVTDRQEVLAALECMEAVSSNTSTSCLCCGGPKLEFYAGSKKLATVIVFRGGGAAWGDASCGWKPVTARCQQTLNRWLCHNKVIPPEDVGYSEHELAAEIQVREALIKQVGIQPFREAYVKGTPEGYELRPLLLPHMTNPRQAARAWLSVWGSCTDWDADPESLRHMTESGDPKDPVECQFEAVLEPVLVAKLAAQAPVDRSFFRAGLRLFILRGWKDDTLREKRPALYRLFLVHALNYGTGRLWDAAMSEVREMGSEVTCLLLLPMVTTPRVAAGDTGTAEAPVVAHRVFSPHEQAEILSALAATGVREVLPLINGALPAADEEDQETLETARHRLTAP